MDNLPPATKNVTAVYNANENYSSSSAAVTAQADASSTLPDFSVTATVWPSPSYLDIKAELK